MWQTPRWIVFPLLGASLLGVLYAVHAQAPLPPPPVRQSTEEDAITTSFVPKSTTPQANPWQLDMKSPPPAPKETKPAAPAKSPSRRVLTYLGLVPLPTREAEAPAPRPPQLAPAPRSVETPPAVREPASTANSAPTRFPGTDYEPSTQVGKRILNLLATNKTKTKPGDKSAIQQASGKDDGHGIVRAHDRENMTAQADAPPPVFPNVPPAEPVMVPVADTPKLNPPPVVGTEPARPAMPVESPPALTPVMPPPTPMMAPAAPPLLPAPTPAPVMPAAPKVETPALEPTAPAPVSNRLRAFTLAGGETSPNGITIPTPPPQALPVASISNRIAPPAGEQAETDVLPLPRLGVGPTPAPGGATWIVPAPRLVTEKRGPSLLRQGETAVYQIVVRNAGDSPVTQLLVEDIVPPQARALAAEPQASVKDGRVRWIEPMLGPGEERSLTVQLQALGPVEVGGTTSVRVTARAGESKSRPVDSVGVQIQGPATVGLGMQAVFQITLTNPGKEPLRDLRLLGTLPEGLYHPMGRSLEADVKELAPGATKTISTPMNAILQGRYTFAVKVLTPAGGEASAQAAVEVSDGGLTLKQPANLRLIAGRQGELSVEAHNRTSRPLKQVNVVYTLPEGLEFVVASNRGLYTEATRTVYWIVDEIPADGALALAIKVQPGRPGTYTVDAIGRADGIAEAKSSCALAVEGFADLSVRIVNRDNAIEVGRDTLYEIAVSNPGSSPATNIVVQVEFPASLQPQQAHGPTSASLAGRIVTFEPLPRLGPQGVQVYRLGALGAAAGDQPLRVSIRSDQLRTPVTQDHMTRVYR